MRLDLPTFALVVISGVIWCAPQGAPACTLVASLKLGGYPRDDDHDVPLDAVSPLQADPGGIPVWHHDGP